MNAMCIASETVQSCKAQSSIWWKGILHLWSRHRVSLDGRVQQASNKIRSGTISSTQPDFIPWVILMVTARRSRKCDQKGLTLSLSKEVMRLVSSYPRRSEYQMSKPHLMSLTLAVCLWLREIFGAEARVWHGPIPKKRGVRSRPSAASKSDLHLTWRSLVFHLTDLAAGEL